MFVVVFLLVKTALPCTEVNSFGHDAAETVWEHMLVRKSDGSKPSSLQHVQHRRSWNAVRGVEKGEDAEAEG